MILDTTYIIPYKINLLLIYFQKRYEDVKLVEKNNILYLNIGTDK